MTRILAAVVLAACALPPRAARADAWTPASFTGPNGLAARGFASESVGTPGARLVVGCESGAKDAWHGVALIEQVPLPAPTAPDSGFETEVVTAFFGRAPVTGRWRSKATADGVLSWPGSGDELRRNLTREDRTRGQATLRLEVRRGDAKQLLVFGVGGFASHGGEIAERCDGWGADDGYKRRERGW